MCSLSALFRLTVTGADWGALSLISLSRFVVLKWPKLGKRLFSEKAAIVQIIIQWCVILIMSVSGTILPVMKGLYSPRAKII
jgi:hypothetical protein